MDQNQPITTYRLDVTFWTCWRKLVFPKRSVSVSHIFVLRLHVISKCSNGSEESASRLQNTSLCQTISLGVRCKVSDKKTLSCETFCFLVNVCYHNLSFVLQLTYCFYKLSRPLPKKIFWQTFRLLKQKISSPSHISRSPIKKDQ